MIATSGYREEKPAPFGNCTSLISAMDLQTGKWVDQWDGEEKTYQIPAALSDVIGGE